MIPSANHDFEEWFTPLFAPGAGCQDEFNCSQHGSCVDGRCSCLIQYSGPRCEDVNIGYFVGFGSVFVFLGFVSFCQLCEYTKQRNGFMRSALKLTVQKMLYLLTMCATAVRGTYFLSNHQISRQVASGLTSAYYPFLLTGYALIVCFWAEAFHLTDIPCDKRKFLSKSIIGFIGFTVAMYLMLLAQLITTDLITDAETSLYVIKIFNGLFAFAMLLVVLFFLIYGVEVYFKIHGAFTRYQTAIDMKQVHMSRFGLVCQAFLQLLTALFLVSEVLADAWKDKLPVGGRNIYYIGFRSVEFGLALWFPCVLWNCKSPEQLWVLNPKRIFKSFDSFRERDSEDREHLLAGKHNNYKSIKEESLKECWICYDSDRVDAGPLIQPCLCIGDVSAVHHECLRKWILESSTNFTLQDSDDDLLRCKVCKEKYSIQNCGLWLPRGLAPRRWGRLILTVLLMFGCPIGAYMVCHVISKGYAQALAIGAAAIIELVCLKFFTIDSMIVYQQARLSAVRIKGTVVKYNAQNDDEATAKTSPSAIDHSQPRQSHSMPIPADVEIHSPPESTNQQPNAEATTSIVICDLVNSDVTSLGNN